MATQNTGNKIFATLEQYVIGTGVPTGITKPNDISDPDYIAPVVDLSMCPIPTTTTTTAATTTTTTAAPTTTTTTTSGITTTTTTTLALTEYSVEGFWNEDDSIHVPPGGSVDYTDEFGIAQNISGIVVEDGVITIFSSTLPETLGCTATPV